jgi:hypothetical protein
MKVGHEPQPSLAVNSTVAARPGVIRRTVSPIDAGCAGRLTVVGVVSTMVMGEVATSKVALVSLVINSDWSWLLPWAQPASRAVIVVCSVPPLGATCTSTFGRGYGVAVGVIDGVSVRVGVRVRVGVSVRVDVSDDVGVAEGGPPGVEVAVEVVGPHGRLGLMQVGIPPPPMRIKSTLAIAAGPED